MRKDGRKLSVKSIEPMYSVVPHIMVERNDSMNYTTVEIPMKPMDDYITLQRSRGIRVTHMGLIMAAYARVVAEFPILNRFIMNKRIYARDTLDISFVVLKEASDKGSDKEALNFSETMIKAPIMPGDTLFEVEEKLKKVVEENKKASNESNMDSLIRTLLSVPGLVRFGVNVFKWMDKHNILPKAVIDLSPFHASCTVTNLASIRTHEIYHHIYNFGTIGVFIAMGEPEKKVVMEKGELKEVKYMPLGVVMDERVADGYSFAKAWHRFRKYLADPAIMEERIDTILKDE